MSNTRYGWRRDARHVHRRRALLRHLRFVGVVGLAIAAVVGLAFLLSQPFGHPRLYFQFVSGANLSGNVEGYFDQPGVIFPSGEQAGLARARQIVFGAAGQPPIALERWTSPNDMRSLGLKLVEPDLTSTDVAIIEIVAAGVSEDGQAQLCWNFGRSEDAGGRLRLAELLRQITSSTRAQKLVILDAGNVEALPDRGMLVNEFPHLLEREVADTGDESLWVLCSHGPMETSHVLESLRRSVFGYFVEQGLTGAADLDGDRQIDVGELHGWVAHAVASYVDRRTGGMESQVPRLLWGGGPHAPVANLPIVVPVRSGSADAKAPGDRPGEGAPAETLNASGTAAETTPTDRPGATDSAAPDGSSSAPAVLLQEAWRLIEQLRRRNAETVTAVDVAPRLFGELIDCLRADETLARGSNDVLPAELSRALLPLVVPLRGIKSDPAVLPGTGNGLGTRLARALQPPVLPAFPGLSLALAEQLAELHLRPLPEGHKALGEALDKFIVQDDRTGFDEWVAKLKPAELHLVEILGLPLLAHVPDLDWPSLREALAVRRVAERAAVRSLGSLGGTAGEILRADRHRVAGEKLLLDGVQRDRNSRAATDFEAALAAYQSVERRAASCRRSLHLKNDLVARAPEYVRWRRAAGRRSDTAGPEYDRVAAFLVELKRFCILVEQQQENDQTEIADLSARLMEIQRRIEASSSEDFVQKLASAPSGPEDLAQIESLLATSFIPAGLRSQLQAAGQLAAGAISLDVSPPDPRRKTAAPRIVLQRQRQCLSQQVELELRLAQLAEISVDRSALHTERLKRLTQEAAAVARCDRDCSEHPDSAEHLSAWWRHCRAFGRELQDWNRELPALLQGTFAAGIRDSAARTESAPELRGIARTLALLSARGRHGAAMDDLLIQAQLADWRDLLAFLGRRAEAALPDASPQAAEYLAAAAGSYRKAATAIRQNPPLTTHPMPALRLSGEAELSLSQEVEGELIVTIQNRRTITHDAWIVVDYDRELLDVRLPADYAVYPEPMIGAVAANGSRDAADLYHPADQGMPPSLTLEPGAERVLKFVIRRRGSRAWPTKLIVKAIADDSDVRHECTVHVPAPEVIELVVDGLDKSWTAAPHGFVLHPFPNQRTAFQLLLRNRGLALVVDLELFPLERPPGTPLSGGTLPREHAESLLRGLSLGPRLAAVAGFKLAGDSAPHPIPFAGPPPPDLDKPAADNKGPTARKAGTAELPFGALLVISEPASGRKIIKRLEFEPQRPRRYVTTRVEYQPDAQIVDIVVRRRDNTVSPERIKLRCEFGNTSDPAAARRRAVGEIAEGQKEARFELPVPAAVEGLRLDVAVDDYPRAFLYRISSLLPGGEVSEDTGNLAVRVTAPEPQSLFACPLKYVLAGVEVDAPPGSFSETRGFWEVGIDKDLDRELTGDNVVRFVTDRQARPELSGYFSDGRLAIDTRVGDFQVQLPADGLCNQQALVVAHASVLGRNAWSVPVEIVLDGAGPRVMHVDVGPDRPLVSGDELEVSATVRDAELSGVAKVDVSFDLDGTGRFAKDPPPLPAALSPTGNWVARLPTEKMVPGRYMILLRGTDKVGNVGDYGRTTVTLYSKEDVERQHAAIRVPLRGAVEYNKMPVPGVKVSLVPADPDPKAAAGSGAAADKNAAANSSNSAAAAEAIPPVPIPAVKTDSDGLFVLPKVPLGKFKLQAEGIFRNKIRKAELEITVDEQTPFKPAPRLKLP